ncbi:glycine betaine ABC transporter substrate-binding protein [Paenibacillus shunpengii]|uniref:Glycine betaine ABC transporter substrate-binding protein n=1 Tax=Paenibacillus shunpengii TaxID=2054424 RepID=A0ABW5SMX9_9BACL
MFDFRNKYYVNKCRLKTLEQYPELEWIANELEGFLTEQEMQDHNAQVNIDALLEDDVARDFLIEKGIIES